ncbi:MAG: J domain-containing protein [Deltaproteobacteria bacterium]|nr:J domain-containing protein [Deltaproteobacteria bacterium]
MSEKSENPYRVLGVSADAGDGEVRAAYLELVKANPPERAPEEFERIRDAYSALHGARQRALWAIRSANPKAALIDLLDTLPAERRFVGPEPWLAVIGERH